jgi:hypothetical protein
MYNSNENSVSYKPFTSFGGAHSVFGEPRESRDFNALTRVEVEAMIRTALNGLFITAVCNDDGTITVTLNGN